MQLPKFLSDTFSTLPLQTVALTAGIFAVVFTTSATVTTLLLQNKVNHLATHSEQKASPRAFVAPPLEAQAAVVYDLTTKQIIYEKNGTKQLPLASLTKLLTVLTASKSIASAERIAVTGRALKEEGDSGFVTGETFTFSDIAKIALVASSNDAAEAIAEVAAEKQQLATTHTRGLMAGTISSLGLTQTYTENPTGLDESASVSGAYGTASDVAHIAESLLTTLPEIAQSTTEPQITATSLEGKTHTLANTNPTVTGLPSVLLSKTGYTDLAGGNLVMIFDVGINHPVAIVVLASSRDGRFTDVIHLRDSLLATYVHP